MGGTNPKLTTAVETYLDDLRRVRASDGATGERSSYGPLANLLNAVGATLTPRGGEKSGHYWRVAGIDGGRGRSMFVALAGPSAGQWSNPAQGTHGDLLDIIVHHEGDFGRACRAARKFVGDAPPPAANDAPTPNPHLEAARHNWNCARYRESEIANDLHRRCRPHAVLRKRPGGGADPLVRAKPKPVVLLIDEIDTLIGGSLISVLRQLRAGYVGVPRASRRAWCCAACGTCATTASGRARRTGPSGRLRPARGTAVGREDLLAR